MRKQFQEIKHNKEFATTNVLLFCETWLSDVGPSSDDWLLENFGNLVRTQG